MNACDKNRLWGNLMTKRSKKMRISNRRTKIGAVGTLLFLGLILGWSVAEARVRDFGKKSPLLVRKYQYSRQLSLAGQNQVASATDRQFWSYLSEDSPYMIDVVPRRLLVGFDPDVSVDARDQALQGFQRNTSQKFAPLRKLGFYVLDLPNATGVEDLEAAKAVLKQRPAVKYVTMDIYGRDMLIPDDPRYSQQEHLPQISCPQAWDIQPGQNAPQSVVIAILDTGVDLNHPDLMANLWVNPGEVPGDGIDNDGNGYVDDHQGWDFFYDDNVPDDQDSHGTHVAGLAAAIGNNGVGVVGSGYNLTIMPVKVLGDSGFGTLNALLLGIVYAADNGADVINMSLGFPVFVPEIDPAIQYAVEKDVVVVAAAGNDDSNLDRFPQSPVCNDGNDNWVLGVAAVDSSDRKASFSNYGQQYVDVAAPGVNVLATVPTFMGSYGRMSGTSMASPVAAGVVGLLKAYRPDFSYNRFIAAISEFSDSIAEQNPGFEELLGQGRVNAELALQNVDIAGILAEIEPNSDRKRTTPSA